MQHCSTHVQYCTVLTSINTLPCSVVAIARQVTVLRLPCSFIKWMWMLDIWKLNTKYVVAGQGFPKESSCGIRNHMQCQLLMACSCLDGKVRRGKLFGICSSLKRFWLPSVLLICRADSSLWEVFSRAPLITMNRQISHLLFMIFTLHGIRTLVGMCEELTMGLAVEYPDRITRESYLHRTKESL